MKTKLRKPPEHVEVPISATEPKVKSDKPPDEFERKGFAFYIAPDGRVDMDRMRESTRSELREILKKPEVIAAFGDAGIDIPVVNLFPDESLDILFDAISFLLVAGFIRYGHVQKEIANEVLPFTDVQKKMLRKPTAKVLAKHTSDWFVKYQDEVVLAMLLSSVIAGKIQLLKLRQAQMRPIEVPVNEETKVPVQ